ncbi:hypothetical protein MMC18_007458 [Xylographa bjoerkii]|nr:hypothetical protein [Xylographa bjoerkii]MCJ1394512.1 hypothetical protein [Xylographa bjoerkii]MCJ1394578.1 hypothetical protein [Xylographa bjoerkii]
MSSSNDRSGADKPSPEDNPFIIFRRYADEQVANLLQSFIGLPSAIASQSVNQRWQPYDDEVQRRRMEKRDTTLEEKERRQIVDQIEEAFKETLRNDAATQTRSNLEDGFLPVKTFQEREPNVHAEDEVLRCPYRPSEQPLSPMSNPFELFLPWPFNYMLFSPYSPLKLERQEHFREHGDRWRNAFEDLLSMEDQDETFDEPKQRSEKTRSPPWAPRGSGFDSHLFQLPRGKMEHKRPSDSSADELASQEPQNDASEETMTELDYYECLLEQQRLEREKQSSALVILPKPTLAPEVNPSDGTRPDKDSNRLGIISTLTTTERVSLPDGTVHTKVMLKKRFADGREESSETVHTTQGGPQPERQLPLSDVARDSNESSLTRSEKEKQKAEKKGWFWS